MAPTKLQIAVFESNLDSTLSLLNEMQYKQISEELLDMVMEDIFRDRLLNKIDSEYLNDDKFKIISKMIKVLKQGDEYKQNSLNKRQSANSELDEDKIHLLKSAIFYRDLEKVLELLEIMEYDSIVEGLKGIILFGFNSTLAPCFVERSNEKWNKILMLFFVNKCIEKDRYRVIVEKSLDSL